ncbi:hypothetical protein GCM10022219_16490 [Microbacterium oryzae]|uniref:2-oxoglutarate dehydrogenase n=1 Tax=Microbacterium oryzae TaxID=743009 RepID=A0A6I6DVA0_9MICO|nr:DUF6049 family protein [Microbacterium oryzae]QGU28046.1 hypothetical protein D7D94_10455 [Microbacterium oryzae]
MTRRGTAEAPRCLRLLGAPVAVALALLGAVSPTGAWPAAAAAVDPDPPARSFGTADTDKGADDRVGMLAEVDEGGAEEPVLSLLPDQDGVVRSPDQLAATATVENRGGEALPAGTLTLGIGRDPLTDRAALDAWVSEGRTDIPFVAAQTTRMDEVGPGDTATVELSPDDVDDLRPGVYPLRATREAAGSSLRGRSVIVVAGDDRAPASVVVPITAPPTAEGLLSADQIAQLTEPGGALAQTLDAVAGTSAVLAVDPAIPAAIRVLGTAAPASALDWLERLEQLPNERFALQFGDADAAAQVQAGLPAPLAPTSLRAFESGQNFEATVPTPSAAPIDEATPEPAPEPEYPSLEELLAIGEEAARVYWPAEGTAGPDVVEALSADGGLTLLPSTATSEGADGTGVPSRAEGALVYDDGVSDELTAAAFDDDAHEQALVASSADLWFAARETGDTPLLVALDRVSYATAEEDAAPAIRTEDSLRDAIESVTRNPSIAPARLSDVLDATPHAVTVDDGARADERIDAVTAFTSAEPQLAHIATALAEPELLTGQARAEALQLLAVGWRDDEDAWRAALGAHAEKTAQRIDGVGVTVSEQVQLLSAEAPLPVWVRNGLAWPITVVLDVSRDSVRLDVQERIEVEVPPGSNPRVEIPVEARVGSGEVQLAVSLFTPTGEQIGPVQNMNVTVRAEWERIGIVVLFGLVAILLVGGVIRTVLKTRRRRRERADGAGANGMDDASGSDGASAGKKDASDE